METDTNTMNELEKETAPVQEPQADLETTATFTQPVEEPVMESIPQPEPPVGGKVKKGFLRACGSWTDIIPIAAMLSVIMILFGDLVSTLLDRNVIPAREIAMRLLGDEGSVEFLLQYFEFFGIWLVFMLIILVFPAHVESLSLQWARQQPQGDSGRHCAWFWHEWILHPHVLHHGRYQALL